METSSTHGCWQRPPAAAGEMLPLGLSSRRDAIRTLLAAGAALAWAPPARSAEYEFRVVTGDSTPATRDILSAIGRRFVDVQVASDIRSLMQRRGAAVYAALGPGALEHALEAPLREPLLSLFSSREAFARLVSAAGRPSRGPVSAIYAEAAPLSQMSLIRTLYARRVDVGVLLSAGTRQQGPNLDEAARAVGVDIDLHAIEPDEDALRAAARLRASPVLLMVPDRRLYTVENLRSFLESTYRSNQAVIGFSTSLVNAGTLAAAYSSIDDTVAQIETVAATMAAGRHVEPQYPLYWRVAINDSVARSLNVVVTDAARKLGNFPP